MQTYEKLGLFYLGRVVVPTTGRPTSEYMLYDSRDLVTHAVCVGMTGSGKTGLCLALLEEAAIDGIPIIAIDPKGDLGNLLLTFPGLTGAEFRPWIDEEEARRKGVSPDEFADSEAARWKKGLEEWDQDGERIGRLRSSAAAVLYTPGSTAGLPVSIVRSFSAPPRLQQADLELLHERASSLTAGLLGLLGLPADPLRSREHILIASILEHSWLAGEDPTLAWLIQAIQSPPLQRVGVFDLEAFYPAADRLQLAMLINNLLASPGFASWIEGEPLDIGTLLHDALGKPRVCVFSIAHLPDSARMYFVTLLLNEILAWVRTQPGTAALRAILYMDEIFGFLPPVAEPPSKRPLLTLLKQARASGFGVVLATQNPVDLDYKALSNTGTWLIGRLQTERDRERLLDGLQGVDQAGAALAERKDLDQTISALQNRTFLMRNIHEDKPVVFQSRWALSYLAGPLTRAQIRRLTEGSRESKAPAAAPPAAAAPAVADVQTAGGKPVPPAGLSEVFAPPKSPVDRDAGVAYHPYLFGSARMHIINNRYGIADSRTVHHMLRLEANMTRAVWAESAPFEGLEQLAPQAPVDARFLPLPGLVLQEKKLDVAMKGYLEFLFRQTRIRLWRSSLFQTVSQPDEPERDFRIRLQQLARERRDFELEKLRQRYAARLNTLQDRLRRAQESLAREREQYSERKAGTAIALGSTLLSALLGRKAVSSGTLGRAATAARQASRMTRERGDVERAEERVQSLQQQIAEIEEQLRLESDKVGRGSDPLDDPLQEIVIRPTKSDLLLQSFGILWVPCRHRSDGRAEPLFP